MTVPTPPAQGEAPAAREAPATREAILDQIVATLERHKSFIIAAHVGPDGDAIGSGLALRQALTAWGKDAWLVSTDGVPVACRFLPGWQTVLAGPPRQPECAVILDCDGTSQRVSAPYECIEKAQTRVLIDHHRSSRPIFHVNWIDPAQSATALMVYRLLRRLPVPMTRDIAQCLLSGISTDTGNFRFPNTTPDCLRVAGELVELGADIAQISFALFDERSYEATRLLGVALDKMQVDCGGELLWTALTTADFQAAGTGDEGSENVVNFLRNVRGARMALIFRERTEDGGVATRISVRCMPELRADLFCKQFGGGGHAAAAGCRIRQQSFSDSINMVRRSAAAWLRETHPPLVEA